MSRPIVMTEEMKATVQQDFTAMLDGLKLSDGKINFSKAFKYKGETATATLWITPLAYRKTLALVTEFSDEVAWHGAVSRSGNNEFIIEDILVYPQAVTGSTVNTEQEAYTQWLYSLDDDTFNKIRLQSHSHVNMGVSPSSVDNGHREKILDQLEDSMFYIFMIWNKRLEVHTLIYDMAKNVLYENEDVVVKMLDDDMVGFMEDAKKLVTKKCTAVAKGGKKYKAVESLPRYPQEDFFGWYDSYGMGGYE